MRLVDTTSPGSTRLVNELDPDQEEQNICDSRSAAG